MFPENNEYSSLEEVLKCINFKKRKKTIYKNIKNFPIEERKIITMMHQMDYFIEKMNKKIEKEQGIYKFEIKNLF